MRAGFYSKWMATIEEVFSSLVDDALINVEKLRRINQVSRYILILLFVKHFLFAHPLETTHALAA